MSLSVSMEEHYVIAQVLYQEASMLDERRFQQWLDWLADDLSYVIPTRFDRKQEGRDDDWSVNKELSCGSDDLHLSDNNKMTLMARVMRLTGNRSFSEVPPSRTVRLIGNVQVRSHEVADCYKVESTFILERSRLQTQQDRFSGRRYDVLRRRGKIFELVSRRVVLNETVLNSPNLSVFF
ncbi:MAG: aromatic-ring-hydroxylating dioxygenase subunit beta [Cellvibrionaceae bacterium]